MIASRGCYCHVKGTQFGRLSIESLYKLRGTDAETILFGWVVRGIFLWQLLLLGTFFWEEKTSTYLHNPYRSLTLWLMLQKMWEKIWWEITKRVLYLSPFPTKSKLSLLLHLRNVLLYSGPGIVLWLILKGKKTWVNQ